MIPLARPNIGKEEERAVLQVLSSGMIAEGKKVAEFENKFAKFIGTKYAVAVSSGTTALQAALLAAGVGKGDEVITTPFTFIATANACLYVGAKPVFVDIKEDDFNINPSLIEQAITKKTKAILPVHLFGCTADMDKILIIAKKHNLIVIEDAAQAHGASGRDKKAGSFGLAGCFSFYATKNMCTGEGGMITTDKKWFAEKCRSLRAHGLSTHGYDLLGYNFHMTDIEAAIGIIQLKKLPAANKKRLKNAKYLNKNIKCKGIILPRVEAGETHVFHQYTIRITKDALFSREELIERLGSNGINASVFYPVPIYRQNLYKKIGYSKVRLPVCEKVCAEVLSLPVHPLLTRKNLDKICITINTLCSLVT